MDKATLKVLFAFACEASRKAGDNIRRLWDASRHEKLKSDATILTVIDSENEELLKNYFAKSTPDIPFFGEEGDFPDIVGKVHWCVDPVDGTTNLLHAFPWCAVSVALIDENHVPLIGVVYNPIQEHFFAAAEGLGCELNGKPCRVSECRDFSLSLLATGFPVGPRENIANMENFFQVSRFCHSVRRPGSAAIDMACVACGWLDGFWEIGLNPWDTAAGAVLVREAGGIVTGFEGEDYLPGVPYVIAANGTIAGKIGEIVRKNG